MAEGWILPATAFLFCSAEKGGYSRSFRSVSHFEESLEGNGERLRDEF